VSIMKTLVQLLATVLAAVVPAFAAGPLDMVGWFNVIVLAAGAFMVYNAANIPGWNYAKLLASGVSAVAVLLMSSWSGGLSTAEIMQLVLAFLGAVGVGAIPNAGYRSVARAA
jgi:hypothetical protein